MRSLAEMARGLKFGASPKGRLCLVTDPDRLPDPLAAAARLPVGSLVILRHYESSDRRSLARSLACLCRRKRLRLLVAGDLGLAASLGCGLHLPEKALSRPLAGVRLWHRRTDRLLTVAAHSRRGLAAARRQKADAALLSPVFPTASHPGRKALGVWQFRILGRRAGLAVYALGGVDRRTVRALAGSKAAGIAAISGLAALPGL